MRLIGSFQTITIHGRSGSATSSVASSRSRVGAVMLVIAGLAGCALAGPPGPVSAVADREAGPPIGLWYPRRVDGTELDRPESGRRPGLAGHRQRIRTDSRQRVSSSRSPRTSIPPQIGR